MWTPKRVLLLILGLAVFTAAYGVYAYFLGRVDGLPPLPPEYETRLQGGDIPGWELKRPPVDLKLIKAFGQDCQEIHRTIKLEVQTKGVVLASDEFSIEPDGRVKLKPFSIAIFSKDKGDGRYPEINTVRSDIGYLTFDQPISNAQEMGTRKIVGGELVCQVVQDGTEPRRSGEGGVRIVNNRHTPERDDDLTLFTPGPVYFQENLHQIWTREPVLITDEQTKPKPTTVNAIGMDVYLTSDSDAPPKTEPAGRRKKGTDATLVARKKDNNAPNVTGVKAIVLRSDVEMHLWVDANSGFMGTDSGPKKAKDGTAATAKAPAAGKDAAPQAPPEKAQVVIKTQGPFLYDCLTDHARFDISQHPGPHPNNVEVHRRHGPNGAWDQLICDHLELQFNRKSEKPPEAAAKPAPAKGAKPAAGKPDPAASSEVELQIETAHAWGTQVTITSDAEALTALGNDLVYNAVSKETTLCGTPEMIAMKDGNEIVAQKLVLKGSNEDKDNQQAEAKGPGRIKLLNRENGTRPHGARWKDMMYFTKDGGYDLLTLTGEAVFEDSEHGQFLQADRLKVWLESADPAAGAEKPPAGASAAAAGDDTQHRRPHHMEAVGHVIAKSAEMSVHDTDRLTVRFKDVASLPGQQLPDSAPAADGAAKPAAAPGPTTAPAAAGGAAAGAKPGDPAATPPAKKPFDIQSRSIDADILRSGARNEMEKLTCEGSVHVQQQPATPQDKGVDIVGDTLLLLHFAEGHVLRVTGDLAKVELEKLTIEGPEVNIDQKDNKAWVVGLGFMRMPSDANFQGEPIKDRGDSTKEPVYLTVHWNRDMFFDGKSAVFHGGIQAEQENSRLACQELQVFLDRFVSLKQTEKTDPPAKVKKLVCDKSVRVEERKFEAPDNKRLIGYQWMAAPELVVDNEENTAHASGPGEVRIMQPGPKDEGQPRPGTPQPQRPTTPSTPPAPEEMKLTKINYWGSMFGNNNTRTAIFYNNVEVVYVPSDDPNLTVDVDKLPQGAMYLRCNQLKVYSRRQADGKASQEMEAHGKASVQAQDYWGRADIIKYDESKDMIVFEAGEGNLATLNRVVRRGDAPQELRGKKIFYWRQSGTYKIEGGVVSTGTTGQDKR